MLLDTIQVTKAVYDSAQNDDDFAPVQMQTEKVEVEQSNDDPFGLPPIKEQQSAAMANDLDDEIPF